LRGMVFVWIWASSVETGGDCAWTIGKQNINVRGRTCFHIPRSCITGPHSAGSNRSLARFACGIDARRVVVGNQSNGQWLQLVGELTILGDECYLRSHSTSVSPVVKLESLHHKEHRGAS